MQRRYGVVGSPSMALAGGTVTAVNAVNAKPEPVESRQVRRQNERLMSKIRLRDAKKHAAKSNHLGGAAAVRSA